MAVSAVEGLVIPAEEEQQTQRGGGGTAVPVGRNSCPGWRGTAVPAEEGQQSMQRRNCGPGRDAALPTGKGLQSLQRRNNGPSRGGEGTTAVPAGEKQWSQPELEQQSRQGRGWRSRRGRGTAVPAEKNRGHGVGGMVPQSHQIDSGHQLLD